MKKVVRLGRSRVWEGQMADVFARLPPGSDSLPPRETDRGGQRGSPKAR